MDIRAIAFNIYQKSLDSSYAGSFGGEELNNLSVSESAFIKRLVLIALRRQEFIKDIIRKYASKKIPNKPDIPHLAIILGAVEILYFSTPNYATVNSYVELAKKKGNKYCGGFVNAVLHKICKDKENINQSENVKFFPPAFKEILRKDYSKNKIEKIEKASVKEAALDITAKENPVSLAQELNGKLMGNGSIRLYSAGNITDIKGYNEGSWWVQDVASSLPVCGLKNIKNKQVLDLCAAPGGKTAQLLSKGAKVTAVDISQSRLETMQQNLQRLNLKPQQMICENAFTFLKNTPSKYDIVLLDAPCSATGTLRRHPEIVHTRTLTDIKENAAIQKKLLDQAAQAVCLNGLLVYAVCSLSHDEGENQIKNFLDSHKDFKTYTPEINLYQQQGFEEFITPEGYIRCLPDMLDGIDGFFVAYLKRIKA